MWSVREGSGVGVDRSEKMWEAVRGNGDVADDAEGDEGEWLDGQCRSSRVAEGDG